MAEILGEAGAELFTYNREGWKFGSELRQRDLYQRQKMRIKQVDLYREDIRNLFDLTVGKMDKYVIVCLVMLGITLELFYKGRSPNGTPSWLFWAWSICTSSAMFYLLMSIWLALHASISAQTYQVRCLTQWLRLPIPSAKEVAEGATTLERYETDGGLLRVPVLGKGNDKSNGVIGTDVRNSTRHDLTTEWQLFTSHFTLFNMLHRMWQAHESYARVCMCIGMNHFLKAMSYFSLAVYGIELGTPWSGWAFTAIFLSAAVIHARMNLNLSSVESFSMTALVVLPAFFFSIAVAVVMTGTTSPIPEAQKYELGPCILACVGIIGHIGWILFFMHQTKSDLNGLPVKFSTVWCIDVLGFGMETLREVQEPVGKETYASRLPGYTEGGPANSYGDIHHEAKFDDLITGKPSDVPIEPGAERLVPSDEESHARTDLPWRAFKLGSVFTMFLWVLALIHTIYIAITEN